MEKQNKLFKKVFSEMEEMGWNLDDNTYKDFMDTYKTHCDFIDNYVENEDNEEDEIMWAFQFIGDFLYCLEKVSEKGDN